MQEIDGRVPQPRTAVRVIPTPCLGHLGCAHASQAWAIVYLQSPLPYYGDDAAGYMSGPPLRFKAGFVHELGHVVDVQARGAGGYRKAFVRAAGLVAVSWQGATGGRIAGPATDELFADAYALCALFPLDAPAEAREHMYGYGYWPASRAQHQRVCAAVRRARV